MADPDGWHVIQKTMFNRNDTNSVISTQPSYLQHNLCDIRIGATWQNIAYTTAMMVILLASVLGNSLVVMATLVSKPMRKRVTIYFVVSLACSDLLQAVFMIPFNISEQLHHTAFCHGIVTCYVKVYADVLCNVASILTLFLIAIDRFIAIKIPFRYQTLLSRSKARILAVTVWIFAAIWSLFGLFGWSNDNPESEIFSVHLTDWCMNQNYYYYVVSYFVIFLIPLVIMTVTYFMILKIALSQIHVIESYNIEPQHVRVDDDPRDSKEINTKIKKYKKKRKLRKELKATKSVAIVYFAFLLCWFPNCVINFVSFFNPNFFGDLKRSNQLLWNVIVYTFVLFLPMLNTMINPIIYSFSNKQFRKAFKVLFQNLMKNIDSENSSSSSSRRNTRSTLDSSSTAMTPRGSRSHSEINGITSRGSSIPPDIKETALNPTATIVPSDTQKKELDSEVIELQDGRPSNEDINNNV